MEKIEINGNPILIFQDLQNKFGLTYLFIVHNISIVQHISDRVAVMYLGKIVELAEKTVPALSNTDSKSHLTYKKKRLILEGDVSSPVDLPSGCRFHPRCPQAMDICSKEEPEFKEHKERYFSAYHLLD